VGIQFQHTALPEFITVEETLKLFSNLYHHRRPLDEVIEISSLRGILKQDNRKLSGGQRQRLLLAIALVNDPEFIFLDEPTTGLDPQARRNFWQLIENIKAENKTILLTTHYMEEAEILCDDIAIMDHGEIIAQGSPENLLKEHFDGVIIRVPYEGPEERLPEGAQKRDGSLEVITRNVETTMRSLMEREIPFEGLTIHSPNLDDLFIKLTGSSLRA
jgi:ABC-2 type transport system ATP-binding protein